MTTLKLIAALIAVESSGNDKAIGDNGKSHGCLQISEKAMIDINQERRKKGLSEFKFPDESYRGLLGQSQNPVGEIGCGYCQKIY